MGVIVSKTASVDIKRTGVLSINMFTAGDKINNYYFRPFGIGE